MGGLLWLPLALVSYAMQAVNSAVDRVIVHKNVTKPIVVSFWVAVFSVATTGILIVGYLPVPFAEEFKFQSPSLETLGLVVLAGFMSQLGLLYMYKSLDGGEVTRVTSIIGAITPVISLIAAYYFLDERLSTTSYVAVALLIVGSLVLMRQEKSKRKAAGGMKWILSALTAGVILSLQSVIMKAVFDDYHFISAFALTGLGALVYMVFVYVMSSDLRSDLHSGKRKKSNAKNKGTKNSHVVLIIANSALGGVAVIILNLALKLGSPTYINALRSVQYALVFIIAILLANRFPRLLDEELTKETIVVKLSGILLVGIGVAVFAIQ